MEIKEGMLWPPMGFLEYKMAEHSAWYSGDPEILANFYNTVLKETFLKLPNPSRDEGFWERQISNQGEIRVHVPIAGDIAETSANFLFSESPLVQIVQAHAENAPRGYIETQDETDKMLVESGFFRKILEAAETGAGIGGVYIKIAWDQELSEYPIPVVVQADRAIPEFSFGILKACTFWKTVRADEYGNKVYRLLERYEKGAIRYSLYLGTTDRLGKKVNLTECEETKNLSDIETISELLCVYIPNMLPNRLDRSSCLGRSDLCGIEGLMDSLDEVYSSWMKDIILAQGRILIPESFLQNQSGKPRFNVDRMIYVKLDVDPTINAEITPSQFEIRADEFEKTSLSLLERIITSAGYSPQSFGLNIQGRAESGTALSIRERKSFSTKGKKEQYWQPALQKLVKLMILIYNAELEGTLEVDSDINVAFSDTITNDSQEIATSVKMVSDAVAASIETKVRMLHSDWNEDQIKAEVEKIKKENGIGQQPEPPDNLDMMQLKVNKTEIEE